MKRRLILTLLLAALACPFQIMAAADKPKTVIHVVTIKWKEGTTPDQIAKAIKAAEEMAASYPGIKRIWTRAIKVQGQGFTHAIVMEFESEEALQKYAGSEAQKKWYEVYLPIRGQSLTHDITN
jgi:antibiotic biosynthesis monooxygenase (ABM) superfamily enzyme